MVENIFEKIKKIRIQTWILLAIFLLGAFLRMYNFHDWLDFGSDQVNDATRVGAVVEGKSPWPAYGPDMGNSGIGGRENRFRIGPIYYDAQIISAKIFGNKPTSMAYPDLLFLILSLPLFYFFLRKVFSINLSIALSLIHSLSFYALLFSHSAWNVNSIPFFSILFLYSLHEFILSKEKTSWKWVIALGSAAGIGIQLHAILLVLFPATLFFAWLLFMRKNFQVWKKIGAIIAVMLVFNMAQLVGEIKNDFGNSKVFLYSAGDSSVNKKDGLVVATVKNVSCNLQANNFMLTGKGDGNCDFSFANLAGGDTGKRLLKKISQPLFILETLFATVFSIAGYFLVLNNFQKERERERKYFFGMLILYFSLSFVVMFPVIDTALRYYVHLIFLPYIFLGLIILSLTRRFEERKAVMISSFVFALLVFTNVLAIHRETKNEFVDSRIVLGEVERMVDYMILKSDQGNDLYISTTNGSDKYYKSLKYVAAQKKVAAYRISLNENRPENAAVFYLGEEGDADQKNSINGRNFDAQRTFNQLTLFHISK